MIRYSRKFFGPLQAAILDWSGTTADKYVIAPAIVFRDVFEKYRVPITMVEARLPMGLRKDLHIKAITQLPDVRKRWSIVYGKPPCDLDVQNMYADFIPLQLNCLDKYSTLIPHTASTVSELTSVYKLKIGSTTGFTESMVDILKARATAQGYTPHSSVAGDQVINGARPTPHMIYKNLDNLNITNIKSVVKVGDTVGDIEEGLNAGCLTVALSRYSNYMDIDSLEHEQTLSNEDIEYKHDISKNILLKSGAHYVVDDISFLPKIVEDINRRLANGESP